MNGEFPSLYEGHMKLRFQSLVYYSEYTADFPGEPARNKKLIYLGNTVRNKQLIYLGDTVRNKQVIYLGNTVRNKQLI